MVSSLSPDFCRIVGQFFCGFQTFLSIQLRPFWCEICQVSKWNYVSWIWLWQLTRSIFNKLNQRISRNSLEILKVFVFFFSPCEYFFFFALKNLQSVCLWTCARKRFEEIVRLDMEESHFWFSGAVENPSKFFFCGWNVGEYEGGQALPRQILCAPVARCQMVS